MASPLSAPDSLSSLASLVDGQIGRVRRLQEIHLSPTEEPWKTLLGYPLCIRESLESFRILSSCDRMRDSFVVARTVLETSVTYCYVAAKGPEMAERAWRHAYQKSYRDLSRELRFGESVLRVEWTGKRPLEELPEEVRSALDEFTTRAGNELRDWTPDNLLHQLTFIREHFGALIGDQLIWAQVAIFRHSSEIAHGSLFGTLQPLGLLDPQGAPSSPGALLERIREQLAMLCLMLSLCVDSVLRVAAHGFPLADLVRESTEAIAAIRQLPWAKRSAV